MASGTLLIPAIDAYATIVTTDVVGHELELPPDASQVAQWRGGASPGDSEGKILLSGHVTNGREEGELFHLADLQPGNIAWIKDPDGTLHQYQMFTLYAVVKEALPEAIWDTAGDHQLVVVTCGGPVSDTPHGRQYRDNVIAIFLPV